MGTDNYTYVYDNIGNRITYTNNGAGIDYSANALNQYTQLVAGASQTNLLYDLDGNLTNDGVRVYSWNGENRLTGVEPLSPASGDKKVAVAYDYMGRRIEKVVSTYSAGWSVTQTNTYLYDGWNLVQETIRNPQSAITNHYTWGLDLSGTLQGAGGIGGLLAWSRSDDQKTFLYCFDANGNVTELLDADDGSLEATYRYDPYGCVTDSDYDEDENNPFRFSSKYTDDETDLLYYGYRYYSSEMGRWLSRDPAGTEGGINAYSFVRNTAIRRVDPLGLREYQPWGGVQMYYLDLSGRKVAIQNPSTFDVNSIPVHPAPKYKKASGDTVLTPEVLVQARMSQDGGQYQCYKVKLTLRIGVWNNIPSISNPGSFNIGTYGYWSHGGSGYPGGKADEVYGVVGDTAAGGTAKNRVFPYEAYVAHERGHAKAWLSFYDALRGELTRRLKNKWLKGMTRETLKKSLVAWLDVENPTARRTTGFLDAEGRYEALHDTADDSLVNYMDAHCASHPNWSKGCVLPASVHIPIFRRIQACSRN